jgi:hypothetical protein
MLYLKSIRSRQLSGPRIKKEKQFGLKKDHVILCRQCGNKVTSPDCIIAVDGSHQHTFTNPAGVVYDIGCFSFADGCFIHGEPTFEHTWFEGFCWNFSLCSHCFSHLGWFFNGGEESFFGLIVDRLIDTTPAH